MCSSSDPPRPTTGRAEHPAGRAGSIGKGIPEATNLQVHPRRQMSYAAVVEVAQAQGSQVRPQGSVERQEVLDVGGGVLDLFVGEPGGKPVGDLLVLRDEDAQPVLEHVLEAVLRVVR